MLRILTILLTFGPGAALAQNLSVGDITKMVDEAQNANNEYRTLLNDPDPERALLAMQVMIEQGDADLQKIALDHGLYSTDASVRRVALESFFRSKPFLAITADGKAAMEADENALKIYVERAGGTVDPSGKVSLNHLMGDFDDKQNCFVYEGGNHCMVRISDATVSFRHHELWSDLTLGTDGILTGSIYIYKVGLLPAEIPVSR
jgi:hypothetical protein